MQYTEYMGETAVFKMRADTSSLRTIQPDAPEAQASCLISSVIKNTAVRQKLNLIIFTLKQNYSFTHVCIFLTIRREGRW